MTNQFQIVITAKDQASAVVAKVGSALGQIRRPIAGIGSAVAQLGDATRLSALGHGVANVGGMAREAAGGLGLLGGSVGAIAGVGSVAGVAALVNQWGQVGVATANAAGGIGIAAGRLRTLGSAAGLAGLEAGAMTGSLHALGATLQDAAYGRAPEAAAMLNILNIRMSRTASGAVDAERAMGDLADAISRQSNPQTQARIAQMFGVEQLLPMLRRGREGWNAYLADVQKYAEVSQDTQAKSEELGQSLNRLKAAAQGVGATIEASYADRFGGIIDKTADWAAANKPLAGGLAEVGVALGVVAGVARFHPVLGLIAGIVQGAALIYEHWNGIGDFVRGELDKISKADPLRFGVREQTTEEKKQREDSGWPSWLPHFSLKSATPEEKPAIAAPQASPPEKSWWRSLFVTPANAAVPPAAAPSAPAVAAPQSTAAALPTAVPPVTVGADTKAITLDPTAVEALTRVAIAEAGNQGAVGLEGVVRTVLNRSAHPAWGGSIPDVVNQRGQFEPVMRAGGDWRNLPSGSTAQRATVQGILDGIASGRRTDPTGGATYFLNRDISERRGTDFGRGRDDLRSAEIGDHSFYKPGVFGEKPTPVPNYSVLLSDLAKAQAEQARAATANPAQPGQQGQQQGQPIQVDVRFSGAVPPGTTASVQGQPDSVFAPTRVNYSTPDFARP